jgi:general secretion pathway protein K
MKGNEQMYQQRGSALIVALAVMFIIMAIVSGLISSNVRAINRLERVQNQQQLIVLAKSAVNFGRAALATAGISSNVDTLQDIWATPLADTTVFDNIVVSGYIIDEQSKFNINDLVNKFKIDSQSLSQFIILLKYLHLPEYIAYNTASYMLPPKHEQEDIADYLNMHPPYRPAGRKILDIAELILVKGTTIASIQKLAPYITAVPSASQLWSTESDTLNNESSDTTNGTLSKDSLIPTKININTATAEVIAAKSGLPLNIAQKMVLQRTMQPFQSIQDISTFMAHSNAAFSNAQISNLDVSSNYFTIHIVLKKDETELHWVAFVVRNNRDNGTWPTILWQHIE